MKTSTTGRKRRAAPVPPRPPANSELSRLDPKALLAAWEEGGGRDYRDGGGRRAVNNNGIGALNNSASNRVVEELQHERWLRDEARDALEPLRLHDSQKAEVWAAFRQHPEAVAELAATALRSEARNPEIRAAAIFLTDLRSGFHLYEAVEPPKAKTGWRRVRSIAAESFIEDPNGTDRLPPGYDLTPSGYGQPGEWRGEPY